MYFISVQLAQKVTSVSTYRFVSAVAATAGSGMSVTVRGQPGVPAGSDSALFSGTMLPSSDSCQSVHIDM